MEKYEPVRDIGSAHFGFAKLMRHRETRELVAVKCIERGHRIDENVFREIINHRSLRHPNIIRFKEVVLTSTHLANVTEYVAGGEMLERICDAGRLGIFSSNSSPGLAIVTLCKFVIEIGSWRILFWTEVQHQCLRYVILVILSRPCCNQLPSRRSGRRHTLRRKCSVGRSTMASKQMYGSVEWWEPTHLMTPMTTKNFRQTITRIKQAQYKIPDYVHVSQNYRHLISRIFVANPHRRATIREIKSHAWFPKSEDLAKGAEGRSTSSLLQEGQRRRTPYKASKRSRGSSKKRGLCRGRRGPFENTSGTKSTPTKKKSSKAPKKKKKKKMMMMSMIKQLEQFMQVENLA